MGRPSLFALARPAKRTRADREPLSRYALTWQGERQLKILVVEDVPALRAHASEVVKRLFPKAEIAEATNGAEGLELAQTVAPDFIIMDVSMPEISGIKAAQKIWQDSPQRKILFWSQYHREAYVRELGKIV
ncbi:MAG: hypothetical protein C0507_22180, partial [Cyanobacteria bacterium PR.3.49]|nr:hypothetical protein [Cyanobacteria bacterium PR.3.49]